LGPLGRPTADPLTPLRGPRGSPVGRPRGPTTLYPRRGFSPAEIAHLGAPPRPAGTAAPPLPPEGFLPSKMPIWENPRPAGTAAILYPRRGFSPRELVLFQGGRQSLLVWLFNVARYSAHRVLVSQGWSALFYFYRSGVPALTEGFGAPFTGSLHWLISSRFFGQWGFCFYGKILIVSFMGE
jgi:hypothetical protein